MILVAVHITVKTGIIAALLWVGTGHHRGGAVSAAIVSEMLARGCSCSCSTDFFLLFFGREEAATFKV